MRQQYSMVNSWQNSVKDLKENHEIELNKFRNINDEVSKIFSNVIKNTMNNQNLFSYFIKITIYKPK